MTTLMTGMQLKKGKVEKKNKSEELSASSSEHHRMATVTHELQEVHCPSEPADIWHHMSNHHTSHSLFNSLLQAAANSLHRVSAAHEKTNWGQICDKNVCSY